MLAEREDIDLERELHKVYKMFCVNQTKLVAMKGKGSEVFCHVNMLHADKATTSARDQQQQNALPPRLTTLCELIVYVKNLELASNAHLQSIAHMHLPGSR